MANEMDGVDLTILHDTIEHKLKAQFPQFKIVEFYREEEERRAPKKEFLPALLLDLPEFELDLENDAGSEQLPLIARFEARLIDTFDQDKAKLKIRTLATQLAYYMFKNKRFHALNNVAVGPVSVDAVTQDDFFPELDRFEVWRVDFSMQILIGDNIWKQTGEVPTPVYSHSPNIGFGHENDYKEIV